MQKVVNRRASSYLTRRRWTEEDGAEALAELAGSGLELGEFARQAGVDPQRLARWRRRLGTPSGVVFHEVVPARVERADLSRDVPSVFEIVLASGRVVRVPASFEPGALRLLLAVVEEKGPC